jgi:hypothetical protein
VHGLIFETYRDYLRARYGSGLARELFADEPLYAMSEAYPDENFARLLAKTEAKLDRDEAELLRDFGAFTGELTFPRLYPAFYTVAGDTCSFLVTIEDRIHELVRATIPDAQPPQLHVEQLGNGRLTISYTSPRRLCRLLEGLVVGTARAFGETIEIEETACMQDGAPACLFEIQVAA